MSSMVKWVTILISSFAIIFAEDCPLGWFRFRDRCYRFHQTELRMTIAEQECKKDEAILITIHTNEQQNFLAHLLLEAYGTRKNVWLGAIRTNKTNDDESFLWLDNSKLNWTNWMKNEPDFLNGGEYCLCMWAGFANRGRWFDCDCNVEHAFACQKPLIGQKDALNECPELPKVVTVDMNSILLGITIASGILLALAIYFADFTKARQRLIDNLSSRPNSVVSTLGSFYASNGMATNNNQPVTRTGISPSGSGLADGPALTS